ncbi:MAG: UvrD-helicase domain-containing protein [Proteobacteria bacterium]|nr:UvrD-helicase domain-containing protein [Pseudomonadota bacterium]
MLYSARMTTLPESAARPAYLANLNPPQLDAVTSTEGPLLVLAGAGTGKTRVLITRVCHLMVTRKAFANQILAVTFTNKAAAEMRNRIAAIVGDSVEAMWLGTFHALAARILRRHAEHVGLKPNFTILDQDDQIRLIKQLLQAENIDDKKWPPRVVHGVIERWKDRGLTPDKVGTDPSGEVAGGRAVELYAMYQTRLKTLNACDFGDLLLHNLTIFQSRPDVLAEYHKRFRYMLVDEYQDTNVAQYMWLRILAQQSRNLCCVGDDDQSIYGWRGAEVGNILRFEKDFPGAKIVRLEQNYRSSEHILAAASGLIAHNRARLGKTLWTAETGGEPVIVRPVWDGEQEANFVADEIETLQRAGEKLGDIAILVRAGFQTREFEERFITLGIPYRVIGGPRFYEREEIRDAIAYFRVIVQPDDDLAFERIINKPRRGIGDATVQLLQRLARARNMPLLAAAETLVTTDELKPAARNAVRRVVEDFARWRAQVERAHHAELAATVLDESGYTRMWQEDKSPEKDGKLENLKELVAALEEYDDMPAFLEHVSLVMENAEAAPSDMTSLMTLHAAKGLEFGTVFLPGWEEGLFPHPRALNEKGEDGLEEERRLAHVGLTRARRRAYVSFAANRRIHGMWQSSVPSRFVGELPPDRVDVKSEPGLWGDGPQFAPGPSLAEPSRRFGYGARRAPILEGRATEIGGRTASLSPGMRVFHQKFGYGRVVAAESGKLEVEFEHSGFKHVMESFVEKA